MQTLATLADFSDRIPGGILPADTNRANAMLEDASAIIRALAGVTWTDDDPVVAVPDVVRTVCMSAAKRAFLNPDGVSSLSLDGHSASFATGSPDVYLTAAEKAVIRRSVGQSGLWTLGTTRSIDDVADLPSLSRDGYLVDDDEHITDIFPT